MPELTSLVVLAQVLHARLIAVRGRERGSVTVETVLITAGLAALAIAIVAIIVKKVTGVANNIPTQ